MPIKPREMDLSAKLFPKLRSSIQFFDSSDRFHFSLVQLLETALKMGDKIASFSQPAVAMAKETVNSAYELSLAVRPFPLLPPVSRRTRKACDSSEECSMLCSPLSVMSFPPCSHFLSSG
jgi:hypothetical protein